MPRDSCSHGIPVLARLNARLLVALDGYMDAKYRRRKLALLRDVPATVVEFGPGVGANLRYIGRGARLIAVEPNRAMHGPLRRRAAQFGVDLELNEVSAEAIDLPDGSVDLVLCTLVLCSVARPEAAIAEARRILRPGGRFVCIEHVHAPVGSPARDVQRLLRRPWRWLFDGCDLCRDTAALVEAAGFSEARIELFRVPTVIFPIAHQIQAVCTR